MLFPRFAIPWMTGLVLAATLLGLIAMCPCATAEDADATMVSSCHEKGTGVRISANDACCCDGASDAQDGREAFSLNPLITTFAAPTVIAPPLAPALTPARDLMWFVGSGRSSPPRAPLRI